MLMHDVSDIEKIYDENYHATQIEGAARSAAVVVRLLLKSFPWVTSVVDVGCGAGAWLHEFQLRGAQRVLGLDAANIPAHLLQIDARQFRRVDFRQPFSSAEQFDLALSLEVADCLPKPAAQPFVDHLTKFSDLIVFGAAGPGQSTRSNANEQWPSYWIGLFAAHGFLCFDILRDPVWYDQRVSWWYAQNTFVFVRESRQDLVAHLRSLERTVGRAFDIVHPRVFELSRAQNGLAGAGELFFPFRLAQEGYKGFNIIQINISKYLALEQGEGAYSPEKFLAGGYQGAYVGTSLEQVKAKVLAARPRTGIGPVTFFALDWGNSSFLRRLRAAVRRNR